MLIGKGQLPGVKRYLLENQPATSRFCSAEITVNLPRYRDPSGSQVTEIDVKALSRCAELRHPPGSTFRGIELADIFTDALKRTAAGAVPAIS